LHILEHFLGVREVVIQSAGGGEFDRNGGDHRGSGPFFVPFAGRNIRQQAATRSTTRQLATF
jgi:hypothetical protein